MIQLVLLTGFLGTGKTTLMTELLEACQDKKVGVIVNDFGRVNIDAVLLQRDGILMTELSNGSIFCACIKENFLESLIEMSSRDIEYLFIESSGLADPASMGQILDTIRKQNAVPYDYRGAICVVDGETFLELYEILPALHRQIEYSGEIILNKADLISEEQIVAVSEKINEINPNAEVIVTSFCRANIVEMLERLTAGDTPPEDSTNTIESRPKTFMLTGTEPVSKDRLEEMVQDLSEFAYRIKGFVNTDQGPIEVSAVGRNVRLMPWREEVVQTELVVISAIGLRMLSEITRVTEQYLQKKLHL